MTESHKSRNVVQAFRDMRRRTFRLTTYLFLGTIVLMAGWMFGYQLMGGCSGAIFMVGIAAILTLTFLLSRTIDKQVACPACGKSLKDVEGYDVFIKQCPHCGVSYED